MTTDEEIMEAMLARAINPENDSLDKLSAEMFCMLVRNNNNLVHKSQEMILGKIRSQNAKEASNAVKLLKECMSRCGVEFQNEVAKFRFLNDLIRLVSSKYEGASTSKELRSEIMDCLLLWTTEFPGKEKILEVYKMLIKEVSADVKTIVQTATNGEAQNKSALGIDEKEFRRLLKSGDPEDLKRANLLIQHRVSQESRLAELNSQHKLVLQEVSNTVTVLNQMLDVYEAAEDKAEDGSEEMNLIRELYMACKKQKPVMKGLAGMVETASEDLLNDTMEINESLLEVLKRYKNIVVHQITPTEATATSVAGRSSDNYLEELLGIIPPSDTETKILLPQQTFKTGNNLNDLRDLFNNVEINKQEVPPEIVALENSSTLIPEKVKPIQIMPEIVAKNSEIVKTVTDKRELKEIDVLSEQLFRDLNKHKVVQKEEEQIALDDDNILMTDADNAKQAENSEKEIVEKHVEVEAQQKIVEDKSAFIKLADINVALEDIMATNEERLLLDDADIKITLTFTENRPSAQVSVIVISVFNKSKLSLKDFVFEASVKKVNINVGCT